MLQPSVLFDAAVYRSDDLSAEEIRVVKARKEVTDQRLLERITLNPKVIVGKPVIKGARWTVGYIWNLLAHGATPEEIIAEYKGLPPQDIQACILFATKALETSVFVPLALESA